MLKATLGNVLTQIDCDRKNWHVFSDGTRIRLERVSETGDRKYTEPVQGIVLDAEKIPLGAEVLVHHNANHPSYEIYNSTQLSGNNPDIKIFSIPATMVYLYKIGDGEWLPCEKFCITERIFEPYKGFLTGIEPKQIPNKLYVKTGQYAGRAMMTLKFCDYELVFHENGRERRLIRSRDNDTELIAIDEGLTEQINNGEVLVGLTPRTAKPLKIKEYEQVGCT